MHFFRLSFSLHTGWILPTGEQSFTFDGVRKERKLPRSVRSGNFDFIGNSFASLLYSGAREEMFFSRLKKALHVEQEYLARD